MIMANKCLPKGMIGDPSYTSGRGARLADLDSDKIESIFENISKLVSTEASESFIEMVVHLEVASCTEFLLALFKLEYNDWVFDISVIEDLNPNYADNEGAAVFGLLSSLGGSKIDDTLRIVMPFLEKHRREHVTLKRAEHSYPFNNRRMW